MSSQRLAMHAGEAVAEALRQGLAATEQRPALVEVMVAQRPYPKV